MQSLSNDIIAHIGSFLCPIDKKACLEAAKFLLPISFTSYTHSIDINNVNIQHVCHRLPTILQYVYTIKPNLQKICISFHGVRDDMLNACILADISDILYSKPDICYIITLHNCSPDIYTSILHQLRTQFTRFTSPYDNNLILHVYTEWSMDIEDVKLLEYFPIGSVHTISTNITYHTTNILHHPVVCKTRFLYIHVLHNCMSIDLSSIDIQYNTHLDMICEDGDITCICPYKITCIREKSIMGFSKRQFYTSCKNDTKMKTSSRLKDVYIYHNTWLHLSIWNDFTSFIPSSQNITYHLAARYIDIFQFIHAMKELHRNHCAFTYIVFDNETYYTALMCRKIAEIQSMNVSVYDIEYMHEYVPFVAENAMQTIQDVYNNMHTMHRSKWFLFTRLIDCHTVHQMPNTPTT